MYILYVCMHDCMFSLIHQIYPCGSLCDLLRMNEQTSRLKIMNSMFQHVTLVVLIHLSRWPGFRHLRLLDFLLDVQQISMRHVRSI